MDTRMQQEGSQYGVLSPEMESYAATGSLLLLQQQQQQKGRDAAAAMAEGASPISSRPPPDRANFDELAPGGTGGRFPEDEYAERGAMPGNRWPQPETQALLRIRSEMDATFKEATLKGPLWEDVSRRLAELGYRRSAKKCKEKFENVQKYYKRTKESRAGRQGGKCYRFFNQLEALQSSSGSMNATPTAISATAAVPISVAMGTGADHLMMGSSSGTIHSPPISAHLPAAMQRPDLAPSAGPAGASGSGTVAAATGLSFSSNTSSSSGSEDGTEEGLNYMEIRKRKRTELGGSGSSTKKMMAFFERLVKDVVEKQEQMMQRFLETIEKKEQERVTREEAWRRQEMARLTREQEIMAQERAISASRDASLIAFLQKFTGQTIQIVTIPAAAPPPPPPPKQHQHQHADQQQQQPYQNQSKITEVVHHQRQSSELVIVQQEQPPETMGGTFDPASSRWPKPEVHALIHLRSNLELRYQEAGPKGPLWEEISKGMQLLGYNRNAKRCKEKWENINKYFKKMKESKKKRREDAKTCPYFNELDALYRRKLLSSTSTSGDQNKQEQQMLPYSSSSRQVSGDVLAISPPVPQSQNINDELKNNSSNKNQIGGNTEVLGAHDPHEIQTSNGGLPPGFFERGTSKKPENIVKELMAGSQNHHHQQQQQQQAAVDDSDKMEDSDDLDEDDDDDDGDESDDEERKMDYKIHEYQKPSAAGPSNSQENQPNSFLAMVQ